MNLPAVVAAFMNAGAARAGSFFATVLRLERQNEIGRRLKAGPRISSACSDKRSGRTCRLVKALARRSSSLACAAPSPGRASIARRPYAQRNTARAAIDPPGPGAVVTGGALIELCPLRFAGPLEMSGPNRR